MEYPKALMEWSSGISFMERILGVYHDFGCEKMVVIINDQFPTNLAVDLSDRYKEAHFIGNQHPEMGRSYSLSLGLSQLEEVPYLYIQNVDNPFVSEKLLRSMFEVRSKGNAVIPKYKDRRGHPVLVHNSVISQFLETDSVTANLRTVLDQNDCYEFEIDDENILANINDREDYERYFDLSLDKILLKP